MGLSGEELDAASPQEIRDWLVRTLKEKQLDITQSAILVELAMVDATFGFGLLTPAEMKATCETGANWMEYARRFRASRT